jgi:basic membrane protein A
MYRRKEEMKTLFLRLSCFAVVIALLLTACITSTPQPAAPTSAPASTATQGSTGGAASGVFKIAVVMPSAANDNAFSQSMYQGLLAVQKDMGGESKVQLAYSENLFNVPDAAAALRDYASKGFNLVIAHGSQFGTSLEQIAPDFPKTSFAWGTSLDTFKDKGINNVFAYQAEAEEGGYVLGVMGAMLSKSSTIGILGPVEAGDAKLYVDGFKQGVLATKPDAKVNVTYTGSFSDVSLMSAAATTQIQNGADVLTGSSQSVVGAIGVAKDKNVFWFGQQSDQSSLAPSIVVASQVYDWTSSIKDMISNIQSGTLGGKSYNLTLKTKDLVIQYNPAYTVPADVKAAADKAIQDISSGTIKVQP